MEPFLHFLVAIGAGEALIFALGTYLGYRPGDFRRMVACLLLVVGVWQTHTTFLLMGFPSTFLAALALLHFVLSWSLAPLLYGYNRALLGHRDSQERWFRWAGLCSIAGAALVPVILLSRPGTDRGWVDSILSVWGPGPQTESGWTVLLANGPRIMVVLIAGLACFQAWQSLGTEEGSQGKAGFPLNARRQNSGVPLTVLAINGVSIPGVALSAWAQHHGRLEGSIHALGASLVTVAITGLYLAAQRIPGLLQPIPTYRRSDGLDRNRILLRAHNLMEEEKLFRTEDLTLAAFSSALSEEEDTETVPEISPSQLSEIINRHLGRNFNQWVNDYRIQEAATLLRSEPDRSILEIALESGFNSKWSFNRAFKLRHGCTPGQYRRGEGNADGNGNGNRNA